MYIRHVVSNSLISIGVRKKNAPMHPNTGKHYYRYLSFLLFSPSAFSSSTLTKNGSEERKGIRKLGDIS